MGQYREGLGRRNNADEGDTTPSEWLTLADRPFHPTSEARRPASIEWARESRAARRPCLARSS
jgi:hypothetical protein